MCGVFVKIFSFFLKRGVRIVKGRGGFTFLGEGFFMGGVFWRLVIELIFI